MRLVEAVAMNTPDDFSQYYAELLEGIYDCADRMVLNAYFPLGQTGGGLRSWWRRLRGDDNHLDDHHLREMAGTFSRRLHAYCDKHEIPILEARADERKHLLAEPYIPNDPRFRGLFLVITGNAPAPVWEVKRNAQGKITELRHRKHWPYVKHYYFHLIDADWGHVTIRVCGYPPFGAQIILNGHEWVERAALREGITVVKSGNCFVDGSEFTAVNELAANLHQDSIVPGLRQVCERWIYSTCLIFALTNDERERSGFSYRYSIFQLEMSRNLLFRRATTMDQVYQGLIDRTRVFLDIKQLKTIFGRSYRPHQIARRGHEPPKLLKAVEAHAFDLTVFKVKWGNLTLKIYDKGARVLRIEVVAHNAKDLRCGKVLEKFTMLLQCMSGMLVRFLGVVQAAHISFLDEGQFDRWNEPTQRGPRRLAGIDLNKARNRHVVDAVVALSTEPNGFTLGQLAQAVLARTGWTDITYTKRSAAYDLAKLCGKQLVERCGKSRRYVAHIAGVRVMCAYLVLRDKVIKPVLAGVTRPRGKAPKNVTAIDQHYLNLREELQQTFNTLGLAP
jgi:hypothetical protein